MSSIMPLPNSACEDFVGLYSEAPGSCAPAQPASHSPSVASFSRAALTGGNVTHFSLRPPPVPRDTLLPRMRSTNARVPERIGDSIPPAQPARASRPCRPHTVRPLAARRDTEARGLSPSEVDRLLKRHTPMVKKIVGGILRRVPGHILVDDLIAAGLGGLWDAIRRCGDLPDEHFQRYAGVRIRGAVYDELRAQDWLPRRMRAAVTQRTQNDEKPKVGVVFFDDLGEGDQSQLTDGEPALNGEDFLAAKAFGERLVAALEQLPARERRIILGHHLQGLKLRDLGAELKVTDARVSQLHGRAMKRLKAMMAEADADAESSAC